MIEITPKPIDVQPVIESAQRNTNGAVVTFLGTVRNNSEGKRVLYLEYDAYPAMAKKKLAEIADEIEVKWGIKEVSIVHRTGRLEIGEIAVVIAVGSPHRAEAFRACEYAIDRIKKMVPIWKKEAWEDGEVWVGLESETPRT